MAIQKNMQGRWIHPVGRCAQPGWARPLTITWRWKHKMPASTYPQSTQRDLPPAIPILHQNQRLLTCANLCGLSSSPAVPSFDLGQCLHFKWWLSTGAGMPHSFTVASPPVPHCFTLPPFLTISLMEQWKRGSFSSFYFGTSWNWHQFCQIPLLAEVTERMIQLAFPSLLNDRRTRWKGVKYKGKSMEGDSYERFIMSSIDNPPPRGNEGSSCLLPSTAGGSK